MATMRSRLESRALYRRCETALANHAGNLEFATACRVASRWRLAEEAVMISSPAEMYEHGHPFHRKV